MSMPPELIIFADSYLADPRHDRANAALVAWPELGTRPRAYARATSALNRMDVRAYIHAMGAEITERTESTIEKIYAEIAKVAFADIGEHLDETGAPKPIHDIAASARAAISEYTLDESEGKDGRLSSRKKLKLHSKLEALKLLIELHQLVRKDAQPDTPDLAQSLRELAERLPV